MCTANKALFKLVLVVACSWLAFVVFLYFCGYVCAVLSVLKSPATLVSFVG